MNRSEKAALFVLLTLVTALAAGLLAYFTYSDTGAVPLLATCVLAAFFLIAATVHVTIRLHRADRALERHGVPPGPVLRLLSRRQWLSLTVGLTIVAIATGSLTGVNVLTRAATPTPLPATTPPAPATTSPPAPATTAPTTIAPPAGSPSGSVDPSASVSTESSDPATPRPGATTYLDSVREVAGGYSRRPVTFSSKRYPRGISLYCSTATSTYVQWNVAGYVQFSAVAGIDDDTQDAFGIAVEMIFYDQDGRQLLPKPVEVSVGHPQQVTIPITGVVSLRMACASRDTRTNRQRGMYAAFGDPVVVYG